MMSWLVGSAGAYLAIGIALSVKAAPMSWAHPPGNLPFWILLWPWPVAAEVVKQITGDYPRWTPRR